MHDDSEVIRSTTIRLFTRLSLVACLALGCEREEPAAPSSIVTVPSTPDPLESTPTESVARSASSAVSGPAASELYVDSDGAVEPAGAMDELIALACGDGPVPDDLEIVFYDGSPDLGIGTPEPERGLYAGNRVVHYPSRLLKKGVPPIDVATEV